MRLCDLKGRFLFEADPYWMGAGPDGDLSPDYRVTSTEIAVWAVYYDQERTRGS